MSFEDLAIEIYNQQSNENVVYKRFLDIIGKNDLNPNSLEEIPLLPISIFKNQIIKTGKWNDEALFMSSGTESRANRSKHHVKDLDFYNMVSSEIFKSFYPNEKYQIIALLPSYLENGDSSLVQMSKNLMSVYNSVQDRFYRYNFDDLYDFLNQKHETKKILIGVTFALVDFANKYKVEDENLTIIFTGGMKNRKREMSFIEVYEILKEAFPLSYIDAEYGMTEMFSQSYTQNDPMGNYSSGRSLKILPKEINDPFKKGKNGKASQLGFIDLGNIDTLSFVLTDDLCIVDANQKFKLLGRISQSDLRGCTLMYQE